MTTPSSVVASKKAVDARKPFNEMKFDNLALRILPVDTSREPGSRQVSGACFSLVSPTPVTAPKIVAISKDALALIGIGDNMTDSDEFVEYLSGNKVMEGSEPAAHCYCGHQFGYFSGQLGDGAAMYLGETINDKSERWELQLKGAGLTPYSRTADGRKVLRSSIREFLCSEAMHHLGIPTTRAGSCITSDSRVVRDIFYDGNPKYEKCTIVSRIAPTFLRFGSFEIFKPEDEQTGRSGPSVGQNDILKAMLDYTLTNFYPDIKEKYDVDNAYVEMFREICHRTAKLVAKWQCFGFCHGVLNTDNMSIVGVTIDYGPFGFMERYDPGYICNGSDDGGRYSYKNQSKMCRWNLERLAEAWQKVVEIEKTEDVIKNDYDKVFGREYLRIMRMKVGLQTEDESDSTLIEDLLSTMRQTNADFSNTFRAFSAMQLPGTPGFEASKNILLKKILSTCFSLDELKTAFKPQMAVGQLQSLLAMFRENPAFLSMLGGGRMGMITSDLQKMEKLTTLKDMTNETLLDEYTEKWNKWLLSYSKRLEKDTENKDLETAGTCRVQMMNSVNPHFILRNHIAQNCIDEAENGNFEEVQKVLKLLTSPFQDCLTETQQAGSTEACSSTDLSASFSTQYAAQKTPPWALGLRVT